MCKRPSGYRWYRCSYLAWLARTVGVIIAGIGVWFFGAGLGVICRQVVGMPPGTHAGWDRWILGAGVLALSGGIPLLIGLVNLHLWADIGVNEKGMAVQTYLFRWRAIPWQDVIGVRPIKRWGGLLRYDADVILVNHLIIWNRVLSLMYAQSVQPAVLITPLHRHRDELRHEIAEHLDAAADPAGP
jgi:hypothetical protein